MVKSDNPQKGKPRLPETDPADECCLVPRVELARLRANQVRPGRRLVALVTGMTKGGIGHAIGMSLALRGHTVIVAERNREAGWEAVRDIRDHGGDAWFAHLDVSNEGRVQRLMDVIDRKWHRLDVVINNAGWAGTGTGLRDTFIDLDAAGFRSLLEANLVSAYVVTRNALRRFLLRQPEGGTCIFLGSTNGQLGNSTQCAYAAAKTALSGLVRVGATEYARAGCRFILVRPGLVETDSAGWKQRRSKDSQYASKEGQKIPMGRLAKPEEIAEVIALLLGPETKYINGAEINVDGGLLASGAMLPGQASTDRDSYVELVTIVSKAMAKRAA